MKNVYYFKMLYFNAGKNILTDNCRYFKKLVSDARTDCVCSSVMGISLQPFVCMLQDSTGAAAAAILHTLAEKYSCSHTVFIFEDDEISDVLSALFIPGKEMFIYNDRWNLFPSAFRMELHGCYYRNEGRKYSAQQYLEMAWEYFEKSEYLNNI